MITLGTQCKVYDFKDALQNVMKPVHKWHFKFSNCKRYILKRSKREGNVLIKGHMCYKMDDGTFKNVNLPGALSSNLNPREIVKRNSLSALKITDVRKLLINHYGNDWTHIPRLQFFVPLLSGERLTNNVSNEDHDADIEADLCEPQEEHFNLIV